MASSRSVAPPPGPSSRVARYFVMHPQVGWPLLLLTLVLGIGSYRMLPQRKDPFVPPRVAVATCTWPGASALETEASVTRPIEEAIGSSSAVDHMDSSSRTNGVSVAVTLREGLSEREVGQALASIDRRLRSLSTLPKGAGPVRLHDDVGDTATVLLALSSGPVSEAELEIRALSLERVLAESRAGKNSSGRVALVASFPTATDPEPFLELAGVLVRLVELRGAKDAVIVSGSGFVAVDATLSNGASTWHEIVTEASDGGLGIEALPRGLWPFAIVDEPESLRKALRKSSGDRYDDAALATYSAQLASRLRSVPLVASVSIAASPAHTITVDYSNARLTAFGTTKEQLEAAILAFDIPAAGGSLTEGARTVALSASSAVRSAEALRQVPIGIDGAGMTRRLGDVAKVDLRLSTLSPYLAYRTPQAPEAGRRRAKAVVLAVQMKVDERIDSFSKELTTALDEAHASLPEGVLLERVSDQPAQVREKVDLLGASLFEAIALIVVIGLIGYRGWRTALVLALSIPVTLAMTVTIMAILRVDIQQVSLASLILALGLLVDDPVVAADSISTELERGERPETAAWLGPSRLARAIFYATATNLVAYLPFLLLTGDVGRFVYALPIVVGASLFASRIVSMTFVPLLGHAFLRAPVTRLRSVGVPTDERPLASTAAYRAVLNWCLVRRGAILCGASMGLVLSLLVGTGLKTSLFPRDEGRLFVVDVSLPEDASLSATENIVARAESMVAEAAASTSGGKPSSLRAITSFVGGGAPRFWYSFAPRPRGSNVGQIMVEVEHEAALAPLATATAGLLDRRIAGARFDIRHLENGKSGVMPVELRVVGDDVRELRRIGDSLKRRLAASPFARNARDDWETDRLRISFEANGKAAANGITKMDIARAVVEASQGLPLGELRTPLESIPILGRSGATRVEEITVLSRTLRSPIPLSQVADRTLQLEPEVIVHRDHVRALTVSALVLEGSLASDVMTDMRQSIAEERSNLPPGYSIQVGGTEADFLRVRSEATLVAVVSFAGIALMLLLSFRRIVKVALVLAAIPFGIGGGFVALRLAGVPLGFMAIVGLISLAGVIVSHILVLFDYLEEAEARGESFEVAIVSAGLQRMRPVLVTIAATVFGLVPLALHGGALWQPLCYAQMGGLIVATVVTLFVVPLMYTVCVRDLGWVSWHIGANQGGAVVPLRPPPRRSGSIAEVLARFDPEVLARKLPHLQEPDVYRDASTLVLPSTRQAGGLDHEAPAPMQIVAASPRRLRSR